MKTNAERMSVLVCAAYASLHKYKNAMRARCPIRPVHHSHNKLFNWILYLKLFFISIFFFSFSFPLLARIARFSFGRKFDNKNNNCTRKHGLSGDIILHTTMAMEIMGRWKNPCAHA